MRPQLRRIRIPAAAVIIVVACSSCASSASHPAASTTSPAAHSSSLSPQAFAELAGDWVGHGGGIDIQVDGRFNIGMRTYQFCGQAPPPCDTISGNEIIDGDEASGQLTAISGEIATGAVTKTTDPSLSPEGPIKIVLDPSTDSISANNVTFCGTSAPAGYCGA
jgi:hypothetical protein